MGLRDDDERIYHERDIIDWYHQKPEGPGYDDHWTEEDHAAHDHAVRKSSAKTP